MKSRSVLNQALPSLLRRAIFQRSSSLFPNFWLRAPSNLLNLSGFTVDGFVPFEPLLLSLPHTPFLDFNVALIGHPHPVR